MLEAWFPTLRAIAWLGFIVYLVVLLIKTYRRAKQKKREVVQLDNTEMGLNEQDEIYSDGEG